MARLRHAGAQLQTLQKHAKCRNDGEDMHILALGAAANSVQHKHHQNDIYWPTWASEALISSTAASASLLKAISRERASASAWYMSPVASMLGFELLLDILNVPLLSPRPLKNFNTFSMWPAGTG